MQVNKTRGMKGQTLILLVVILFSFDQRAGGQLNVHPFFEHISTREGLSHVGINTIYQDSRGFLWIGTYDGLNRFDGINFTVFHHIPSDSSSLANNRIHSITESHEGLLWIGTEEGLCNYDIHTEKFGFPGIDGFPNQRLDIRKVYEDLGNRLWLLTSSGEVYIISRDRTSFKSIYIHQLGGDMAELYDITRGPGGYYYVSSSSGMIIIDEDLEFETEPLSGKLNNTDCRTVSFQNDSTLWLGSGDGLILAGFTGSGRSFETEPVDTFLTGKTVRTVLIDHQSNIWAVMGDQGLARITCGSEGYGVQEFRNVPSDLNSLSSNRVRCLFEDSQGNLWIGTVDNGLNRYNLSSNAFYNLNRLNSGDPGLRSDIILSFLQMETDRVLVGTRDRGIHILDPETGRISIPDNSFSIIGDRSVSNIFCDSRGWLWIKVWGGLFCMDPGNNELKQVHGIADDQLGICEDDLGNLWMGAGSGLRRVGIDRQNRTFEITEVPVLPENSERQISGRVLYKDPFDGSLWLGTYHNGLFNIEIPCRTPGKGHTGKIINYKLEPGNETALRSSFVTSVLRTSESDIWVGTEGGGFSHGVFSDSGLVFTTYDESDGLSNNVVKAIVEDDSGDLWISTNRGLNKFVRETGQFVVFNVNDGLPSDYFTNAALKLSDNRILLGGNKGLTLFDPENISQDTVSPIPEIGSFQLSYETVYPLEKINNRVVLERSVSETGQMILDYRQNTFSFELLALYYTDPHTAMIKYRLRGYDKDWIYYNKGHHTANYANVRPGKYTLEFDVANRHGNWSDHPRTVSLTIKPPVWGTVYAYILYVLALASIVFLLYRNSRRILMLKHKVKIEEIELQKNSELNEMKLKFFMNVSHEIKTPVSLISGPAQWLLENYGQDGRIGRHLSLIRSQSDYLLNLLDQLVYFRKAESDTLDLKCVRKDIVSHIDGIKNSYSWQSEEKRIDFGFIHPEMKVFLWFNPKSMDMIMHNLISNAFRYTKPGGRITVVLCLDYENEEVNISLKDTGKGIPRDKITKIFQRFYQEDDSAGGYGIGLSLTKTLVELHGGSISVNSIVGKGTEFLLRFKTGKGHLKPEQVIEEEKPAGVKADLLPIKTGSWEKDNLPGSLAESKEDKSLVLIVEDNLKMLSFLKEILDKDYRILSASNGMEAMELVNIYFPDLILSDIMMPEMDGITLCRQIKQNSLTSHIPVILLTAKEDIDSRVQGFEEGADAYIPKPMEIKLLQVHIKSLLENRNKIRERIKMNLPMNIAAGNIPARDRSFLEKIRVVAEENYTDYQFDSRQFSKKVFINRSQFYKKIKSITNRTPSEFLREFRMNKAAEFMIRDKVPVSEVHLKVGILSRSHFTKSFKDTYGILPSQFIKKFGIKEC